VADIPKDMVRNTAFYDRAKANAYEKESRAKGLFIRRSEAKVRVNPGARKPGGTEFRPRWRILIVERCG
jgi:hypothetical protein